jgi:hypothetical protein
VRQVEAGPRDPATPLWQFHGIGRAVHDAFLSGRSEKRATLANSPKATDTQVLYERWGWQKMGHRGPASRGANYREYVRFVLPLSLPPAGR